MKSLPIRMKITMWFTAAFLLVVSFAFFIVFLVHLQIVRKIVRDNLVETVEDNVDEVEYYTNIEQFGRNNNTDYLRIYQDGYLEIDDDFLDRVNGVCTALYSSDMAFLYGENPIPRESAGIGFCDSKVQQVKAGGNLYFIFDRKLTAKGLEGLWLRGVVSETQGEDHMTDVLRLSLLFLPLLVVCSALGGYLLTKKMLSPIQAISESACGIGTGNDLGRRIVLGEGKDELHQLAESFNGMFARLEKAFETERQFTSDASHELRTPVSVILAQCEFSLEEPRSGEEYERALRTILRQGRRMSRLINDMLDFSRLEMRADSFACEEIDMAELVESACTDLAFVREHGITLRWEAERGIVFCGNRGLLTRLLTNLVNNAYRYGRENGRIFVCLKRVGEGMELSVSDDGIGIAEEEQEKIFRRFYQSDHSRCGTGAGLGLAMVEEIAKFHNGSVRVESEPGKGSRFVLVFPAGCFKAD